MTPDDAERVFASDAYTEVVSRGNVSRVIRNFPFCIFENKCADKLRGICAADQGLFSATYIVQSLYFLNPKFQRSRLLWLHRLVCN